MQRRPFLLAGLSLVAAALPSFALAQPVAVGQSLPQRNFVDQHDKSHDFPGAGTRLVLFAVEKAPSDWVNAALTALGAQGVQARGIVFLADISGMPGFVTRSFALPKMRQRPYPILLVQDAQQADFMPREKDAVTVLRIKGGKVLSVAFARDEAAVKAAADAAD